MECFVEHNKEGFLDETGEYIFMLEASEWEEHLIEMEEIQAGKVSNMKDKKMYDENESSDDEPESCMTASVRKKLILERNYVY
jgi:hypothetical protein